MIFALLLAALQCPAGAQPKAGEFGEEQCVDAEGKLHGPEVTKWSRSTWEHGEQRAQTLLFDSGKVQSVRRWVKGGKPEGTWDLNWEDGTPAWRRTWARGALIAEQLFERDGKPVQPAKKVRDGGTEGGGLAKSLLMVVIKFHQNEVKFCYEIELQRVPNLDGKVTVHFVIDPAGRVSSAEVTENTFPGDAVSGCMIARIKKWDFPKPLGGGKVDVTFPWVFKPVED